MQLYKRIRDRRVEKGYSQSELAQMLGYKDRSTIAKIESGKNDLNQSKIEAFAQALNTTAAYLMGWTNDPYDYDADPDNRFADVPTDLFRELALRFDGDLEKVYHTWQAIDDDGAREAAAPSLPHNVIPMPRMRSIPLIGTIACGTPILAEENIEEHVDIPEHVHADFALRCKGDSMINARVHDGDIVYIRQQPTVNNGEIAAVLIDDEATLKRVYVSPGTLILQAENPNYEPMVYTGEQLEAIHILGKAVGFTSTDI